MSDPYQSVAAYSMPAAGVPVVGAGLHGLELAFPNGARRVLTNSEIADAKIALRKLLATEQPVGKVQSSNFERMVQRARRQVETAIRECLAAAGVTHRQDMGFVVDHRPYI